jgi:hypothetical protein
VSQSPGTADLRHSHAGAALAWFVIIALLSAWFARDALAAWLASPQVESDALRIPARIILKSGQLAVPCLLALAAVLSAFGPSKAGWQATGKAMAFGLAWLVSVTLGARLGNIGLDSVRELLGANAQEAKDFWRGFVLAPGYARHEIFASILPATTLALCQGVSRLRLRPGDGSFVATAITILLVLPVGYALAGLVHGQVVDYRLIREFSQRAKTVAAAANTVAEPVNVVLVIGESTAAFHQSLYGYPRRTNAALDRFRDDLVIVRDAIAPYSLTRESLVRLLSVSADPLLDQYLPESELKRANLIELLEARGVPTYWLSNQAITGDWDFASQLYGRKAKQSLFLNFELAGDIRSERRFDHELLPALRRSIAAAYTPSLVVLHWYAGHHDYCRNIPMSAHRQFNDVTAHLPWIAKFGNLKRRSQETHLREIDCYDSAMSYVSENLADVIDTVRSDGRPYLVIFVSDHGEDPLAGTYHNTAVTRLSHLHVPLYLYLNPALANSRPQWIAQARRNANAPYATAWLADTVLDAFGLRIADRPLQSLFARDYMHLPRRSLVRDELLRGRTWVDVDETARNQRDRADGLLRHRRQTANHRANELSPMVCAHRANSYYKFLLASTVASCIELDVVVPAEAKAPLVTHPPVAPSGLTLDHVFPIAAQGLRRLWLDVKTSDADSLLRLKSYLSQVLPSASMLDVLVEVEVGVELNSRQIEALDALRRLPRVRTLFYVPYAFSTSCTPRSHPEKCREDLARVDSALRRGGFDDVSFDLSLLPFVRQLTAAAFMRKHIWGSESVPPDATAYTTVILPVLTDFDR